jgi:hypothetical protein
MTTATTVHDERAARGAAVMDRHDPRWRDRVDAATFDVQYTHLCVIGQYFGAGSTTFTMSSFDRVCRELGAPDESEALAGWLVDHGFDAPNGDYDPLTAAWRAHLNPPSPTAHTETEEN